MLRSKTNRETASTSFKDASKKCKNVSKKKNRSKLSVPIPLGENETQSCQNNNTDDTNTSASMLTADESSTKKTDTFSTPKRENTFRDMETPEARTQTRLTLKYDDLLLSQTVDPQCEVSWECISPEVIQKIHRDMQRKPNLDISKILALLKDFQEDDPSSNSSSINISTMLSIRPYVSCSKTVPLKRKLKSTRKGTTSSKMEEMIQKLEMQIKNEAEKKLDDDSENHKRITDTLETILPLQRPSSEIQGEVCANPNSTEKCLLPNVSGPSSSSSDSKATASLDPIDHNFDSAMTSNEETSWSDDDLFCDESFIAKVAQTSENKTYAKIDRNKCSPAGMVSDRLLANAYEKNTNNRDKNSLLNLECTDATDKYPKTESNGEFPNTCKSANSIDSGFMAQTGSGATNDIDIDFSDSDTDELLSQITEQEISCSAQLVDKKDSFSTRNVCTDHTVGLPHPVTATTVDRKTDKKLPVIEKTSVGSYLEFLDIPMSDFFRKPSPRKLFKTADESSKKKNVYNFKSIKNNKQTNKKNISATCTLTSKQNNNVDSLDNLFDDPFNDKDDEILRCAESLDKTEEKVEDKSKKPLCYIPESLPKAKSLCTKEQIERKKREALIRRKKLCAITRSNMK